MYYQCNEIFEYDIKLFIITQLDELRNKVSKL